MKPKILILCLTLLSVTSFAACNTIRGAGRDVSAGGEVVSDAASKVQADIATANAKDEADRKAAARAKPYSN
ncbi:entericidin A/B family lipoprotein [Aquidulcibacter sp.]|jgi:predicted small secreted protein|uniref:entericidin A/B family lipoprotein n=1 Tax=Aquidulcibacter sp. TaxID=2052990 RepID=UPI00391802BF